MRRRLPLRSPLALLAVAAATALVACDGTPSDIPPCVLDPCADVAPGADAEADAEANAEAEAEAEAGDDGTPMAVDAASEAQDAGLD